jgi:hypothetical protein
MPSVTAAAAVAAGWWLLRRDGAWDTYHTPLFWPFLFAAGIMAVFSTTDAPEGTGWRGLVARCAAAGAVVAGLAALVVSRNPIYDLHTRDMFALATFEALLIVAAGAATELGERYRPGTWIRTAWCVAAAMVTLALIPSLLLAVH